MFNHEFLDDRKPNGNLISRGRDYGDPIGDMIRAVPPGTDFDRSAIRIALFDTRRFSLLLIDACLDRIMDRINFNCAHAARAVGDSR